MVTNRNVPDIAKCPLGGKHLQLRTTGLNGISHMKLLKVISVFLYVLYNIS